MATGAHAFAPPPNPPKPIIFIMSWSTPSVRFASSAAFSSSFFLRFASRCSSLLATSAALISLIRCSKSYCFASAAAADFARRSAIFWRTSLRVDLTTFVVCPSRRRSFGGDEGRERREGKGKTVEKEAKRKGGRELSGKLVSERQEEQKTTTYGSFHSSDPDTVRCPCLSACRDHSRNQAASVPFPHSSR